MTRYIHRLLMEAFIPNPNNYPCVNHIDGNKSNNSLDNLEWCTQEHNIKHAWSTGLAFMSERRINALNNNKLKNRKLILNTETGIYYNGIKEALDSLSINKSITWLGNRLNNKYYNDTNLVYVDGLPDVEI